LPWLSNKPSRLPPTNPQSNPPATQTQIQHKPRFDPLIEIGLPPIWVEREPLTESERKRAEQREEQGKTEKERKKKEKKKRGERREKTE
jgi:hypothetical protein